MRGTPTRPRRTATRPPRPLRRRRSRGGRKRRRWRAVGKKRRTTTGARRSSRPRTSSTGPRPPTLPPPSDPRLHLSGPRLQQRRRWGKERTRTGIGPRSRRRPTGPGSSTAGPTDSDRTCSRPELLPPLTINRRDRMDVGDHRPDPIRHSNALRSRILSSKHPFSTPKRDPPPASIPRRLFGGWALLAPDAEGTRWHEVEARLRRCRRRGTIQ